ncbi:hypothetical protein ACO0QE_001655 [Hanseniaspora vineae]
MTAKLHEPWPTFVGLQNTNLSTTGTTTPSSENHLTTKEELEKQMCKYAIIQKNDEQLGDGQFSVVKACCNIKTKKKYAMKLIHKKLILDKLRLIQREVGILRLLRDKVKESEKQASEASNSEASNSEASNSETNNIGGNHTNGKENHSSTSVCSVSSDSSLDGDCETEYLFKGHHHVLQLFDFFETREHIVLITQLCDRGDLYDYIISNGSLNLNKTVRPYTACILSGLKFLHDNGIVHRDIKAENILFRMHSSPGKDNKKECPYDLKSHDLIIADFGLATFVENTADMREYVGTLSYISPEIVACHNTKSLEYSELIKIPSYDYKVDIWALGVLCYFMKFGYMPFDCESEQETLDCIKDGDYYLEEEEEEKLQKKHESHVEKEFLNFLQHCFTVNQHERPSSTLLLSHPFVNKFFHDTVDLDETALQEIRPVLSTIQRSKSTASIYMKRPPSRTSSQNSLKSLSNHSASQIFLRNSSLTSLSKFTNNNIVAPNPAAHHTHNYNSQPDSDNKNLHYSQLNSTFKLEPEISENYLMVGSYCESPSVYSSYANSPMLSRGDSTANMTTTNGNNNNNSNNNNNNNNSSSTKTTPSASSNLRISAMSNNTGSTSNTSVSLMSVPNSMGKYSNSQLKNSVPRSITPSKGEKTSTAQSKGSNDENAHPVFYL